MVTLWKVELIHYQTNRNVSFVIPSPYSYWKFLQLNMGQYHNPYFKHNNSQLCPSICKTCLPKTDQ